MDPSACRVIYIDERFNAERWISRDGLSSSTPQRSGFQGEFSDLPPDLQTNVNAFLSVFNQGGPTLNCLRQIYGDGEADM